MSEHAAEIIGILSGVLTALIAALWFMVRKKVQEVEGRLDRQEVKLQEIEREVLGVTLNYTKKFDEVHQALAAMQQVLVERIHDLQLAIVANHSKSTTTNRR